MLTHQQFESDLSFSIQDYFEQSFFAEHGSNMTEVVLCFDTYQARYVREHPWHHSQQIEEQPDGQLILRFRTGALEEVKRRVLSYGRHVKVLEPEHLAQAITDELRVTLENYENCK